MPRDPERPPGDLGRRDFIKITSAAVSVTAAGLGDALGSARASADPATTVRFEGPEAPGPGPGWQTLNPGYWKRSSGALRRCLSNYGDRARATGFPFHYETHRKSGGVMGVDYDPSLPAGIVYRPDWKLEGEYAIEVDFTMHGLDDSRREGDRDSWRLFRPGYGRLGLAIGAKNLFESFNRRRQVNLITWADDGQLALEPTRKKPAPVRVPAPLSLKAGTHATMRVHVRPTGENRAKVTVTFGPAGSEPSTLTADLPRRDTEGYFGLVSRGRLDFEVNEIRLEAFENRAVEVPEIDCLTCYPLGDTLEEVDGQWRVRFVALLATGGEKVEIRVSDREDPSGGWESVSVAGSAPIVDHRWRRNTASVPVTLPHDPSEKTLYYKVYKDGVDVTADPRPGTAACGPGTGFVGDVPASGRYVGRLPRLRAPYRLCGLSCHAIHSGLQQPTPEGLRMLGGGGDWLVRDQPTLGAYREFEDHDFQILCWEDDVWYLELLFYPPSTDDAMKVITMTIAGPTTRWQMMRHWNIINPGDHDYGMDDIKGPEQLVVRRRGDLGQDPDYLRRNFQIVQHLIGGDEEVDPRANPRRWRAWRMPDRDFTLVILDSRLWRSSQDTAMWDDEGWGKDRELYDRSDPTRSLLGEEQFAWLQELVRTESSRLIALTGLNGLHTVWTGGYGYSHTDQPFAQRDRVTADYAGWVRAGADRVIELLGSRDGIVTVYGDVHNGCILENLDHGLVECSFGPIGRSGGRSVIPGFGPEMVDHDGRPLRVHALYHQKHASPDLKPHARGEPYYWNFLEMALDPRGAEPTLEFRIRNLVDGPDRSPRGGGSLRKVASATGRRPSSRLPGFRTLPAADIRLVTPSGRPLRGTRSEADGRVHPTGLVGVPPGTRIIFTAFDGRESESRVLVTVPV